MKKSILVISALFLATSSAAVLCACGGGEKGVTEVAFASYESWQDGFYNINMMDGFGRISRSDEQAHGGSYSAKLQPLGSVTDPSAPYFYYPMQMEGEEGYHYADFSKLDKVSFFMYNAEADEREVQLAIVASISDVYSTDYKVVGTYSLAPGTWTEIEYQPDYEALQDLCDITNVAGLGFVFENQNSSSVTDAPVLYLDDLTLSVSEEPLAEIRTSEPGRGEVQSFDLASSLVYVRLESGIDYGETYLAAGSDKLPEGVKGGVEFAVTDAEMGTWPRLRFDSRTPQEELVGADRFSIRLYFGTEDETVKQVELHMFPDTSSEYVEYLPTNEWVKLTFESETVFNNWGDSIGVKALGLFWLQNGGSGCFNAIDTIRVADIRAEFDEVRVPELPEGQKGQAYSIPKATLEVDGTPVTAEKWSYSVSYRDKELYEGKFGAVEVNGNTFTPQTGGVYLITYRAEYGGKTYEVTAEVSIARDKAAEGEIESFDDPASLDGILMNSGTGVEYTDPEYLWAGDDRLDGASEGTKGGVEYTIDPVYGTDFDGSWPRFYLTSRITASEIAKYDTVSFDLYLDAPSHNRAILVKMYPETDEFDKYVSPNQWVTVRLDAEQFADYLTRISPDSYGFFWVQNGDPANVIEHIRIANLRAYDLNDQRPAVGETEVEFFGDELSLDNLTITGVSSVSWNAEEKAAVASVDPAIDVWMDVSVRARQDISVYEELREEGYNAVTLELFLKPAEGSNARNAQMQYWASQNEYAPSQASVAIGEWVTLTFDLDTYLEALSSSRTVKLFWVASYNRSENTIAKLSEVHIRNVQVAKADDAVAFGTGAEDFFLLDSPENPASSAYFAAGSSEIPSGVPEAVQDNGAVRLSLGRGAESWPHIKFSADRNLFEGGNTVTVTLYVKSTSSSPLSIRQWPHGGDWIVKGELPVNQWVEFKVDAEVLRSVYNWAPSDGIEYTDLLWFTNAGGRLVSEVWIAGLRVSEEEPVSFEDSGIGMENITADQYEAGETGLDAWFGILSKKGYAYKLTIQHGETVLVKGTDYTVSDQDASVTLLNCEAGEYTFVFESYGDRFERGELTVTVKEKEYTVSVAYSQRRGMVGTPFKLPSATLRGATEGIPVEWSYTVSKDGENYPVTDGKFTPDAEGEYTVTYTATYRGRTYTGEKKIEVDAYKIVLDGDPAGGTTGLLYTIGDASLVHYTGKEVESGVKWTYTLSYGGDEYTVGSSFTPGFAGVYTLKYTASYAGKTYTTEVSITIYRVAPDADEVESFNDPSSLSNVQISDTQSVSWSATDGVVAKIDQNEDGNWVNVTLTARQQKSYYENLLKDGYNALTLELYLEPAAGNTSSVVQMNWWGGSLDGDSSQGAVAVGKWVKVSFDLETYLKLMGSDGSVKLFWVQSSGDARILELKVRNVKVETLESALAFEDGAEGFFYADGVDSVDYAFVSDLTGAESSAVRIGVGAGSPNIKFAADKKFFEGYNAVELKFMIEESVTTRAAGKYTLTFWPDSAAHRASGFEVTAGKLTTVTLDAQALLDVYGWSVEDGINYTNLFWFNNPDGTAVAVYIAGIRGVNTDKVTFEETGITTPDSVTVYENEKGELQADFAIKSTKGYAYKLTVKAPDGSEVTDYTVNNNGIVTVKNPQEGIYTLSFESYGGRFEKGTISVEVKALTYSVKVEAPQNGTVGEAYTLPTPELTGANGEVTWEIELLYGGQPFTGALDGLTFTPDQAGVYTVVYKTTYKGTPYSSETFTFNVRTAAAANEIESFSDELSLDSVRLESGTDFEKTYLSAESDKLPSGAKGGVSFEVTDGDANGNWPNLHFNSSRISAEAIKGYDTVVIPMYIGVKAESGVTVVQIEVNGTRVFVKTNTWVTVNLDASYFADKGTESVLWIQNGGDGVVNQVTEVRIASVYAENTAQSAPALLDMNTLGGFSFSDVWHNGASLRFDGGLNAIPVELKASSNGSQYAMRFYFEGGNDGTFSMRTRATDQSTNPVQAWLDAGYTALDISFYAAPLSGNSVGEIQVQTIPGNNGNRASLSLSVGEWVALRFGLEGLKEAFFWNGGDSAWQIELFYMNKSDAQLSEVWVTDFTVSAPSRIDVVSFESESTLSAFNTTENASLAWMDANQLDIVTPEDIQGVVKLTPNGNWNIKLTSKTVDKSLYKSYSAKMLIYLASDGDMIDLKAVHDGKVTLSQIQTNSWVTIEVPAYQDGDQNDLYDVFDWFGGSTGWLQGGTDVTAVYVAGVWLESPTQA